MLSGRPSRRTRSRSSAASEGLRNQRRRWRPAVPGPRRAASVWRSCAAGRSGSRRSRTRRRGPPRGCPARHPPNGTAPHSLHQLVAALAPLLPQVLEVLLGAAGQLGELLLRTGHRDLLVGGALGGRARTGWLSRAPVRAGSGDEHPRPKCGRTRAHEHSCLGVRPCPRRRPRSRPPGGAWPGCSSTPPVVVDPSDGS